MSLLRSPSSFAGDFKKVTLPLTDDAVKSFKAGDLVHLSGKMYTGRDQTHRRLCALLDEGKELPVDLAGELLYYVGPSPARPGRIIGAAGPMGQMHTIRLVCSGVKNISIVGTDFDDERLASLGDKAKTLAKDRGVALSLVNPQKTPIKQTFSYFAIMAPVGPLVAQAVKDSTDGALINIFAGIPASVKQDIDLDTYIGNRCFMFGTSGSRLKDMKIVLEKVLSGQLDTDCSVDAVCGSSFT